MLHYQRRNGSPWFGVGVLAAIIAVLLLANALGAQTCPPDTRPIPGGACLVIEPQAPAAPVAPTPGPRPQCTDRGWYKRQDSTPQITIWNFAIPGNRDGACTQGACCHTQICYGHDGAMYLLLDQCHAEQHCTGTQGTYRRPADPGAAAKWDYFYTDPEAETHRHSFGYYNESFRIPGGTFSHVFLTLDEVQPQDTREALGRSYGCSAVTPQPTVTGPTRTRTPTPRVTATRTRTAPPGPCAPPAPCPVTATPSPRRTATTTATRIPTMPPSRWNVQVTWNLEDGTTGQGKVVTASADSTLYWFFQASNWELMTKVLDGCGANGRWWFFAGGTTNVGVVITVKDRRTGFSKSYTNPAGRAFLPIQDTSLERCAP